MVSLSDEKLSYKEEILKFVSTKFFMDLAEEELDMPLIDLGIDSVDKFNFIFFLEEELGIKIENDDMNIKNFESIRGIINFCERNGKKNEYK